MALHPFRIFRKNQKGCLAGATLLAMISFLFLGVIIQLLGGRGGPGSQIETFAECRRFGDITSIELSRLSQENETLRRFLVVLYQNLTVEADETKQQALYPLNVFIGQLAQIQTPEQLINSWLITQYAQETGLAPDWNDVQQFLTEITGNYLSDTVYNETLRSIGISQQTVEYLLTRYIAQQQISEQLTLSAGAVSPATRWDWYQRLYRQVTVETAAVPVKDFIGKVSEPSENQLVTFFEEHKDKEFDPVSDETGFILPLELAIQYVVAKPSQQMLDSITDDEMLAYYETNKDTLFRKQTRPLGDYPALPGTTLPMMPGGLGGALSFPIPDRPTPNMQTPIPENPAPEESNPEKPAAEKPNTESPAEKSPAEETSSVASVKLKYVSYQAEEESATEGGTTAAAPESETAAETSETGHEFTATKSEPAESESETAEMEDKPMAAELETAVTESEPMPESVVPAVSEPVDLSILYRPFDEVKEEIRNTLALEKAVAKLPVIQAKMQEYAAVYHAQFEQGKTPPAMPDLTQFVIEQGLELITLPRSNVYTMMQSELARGIQERNLIVQLYYSTPLLFESETYLGSNGQLLYWITEQKPEERPESIDEVKDFVLQRWKEVEARALAQKQAEELAAEAKKAEKPLAEVFAGRNDIATAETEPFTWKTYGNIHPLTAVMKRQPPTLSEVREKGVVAGNAEIDNKSINAAGTEFMQAVFGLELGESTVVFNQPKTTAYVVRLTSSSPSPEVLWERFQTAFFMEYFYAGQPEMMAEAYEAWLGDIQTKTGFRWIKKPDYRF